jgi:hypothetical protein
MEHFPPAAWSSGSSNSRSGENVTGPECQNELARLSRTWRQTWSGETYFWKGGATAYSTEHIISSRSQLIFFVAGWIHNNTVNMYLYGMAKKN